MQSNSSQQMICGYATGAGGVGYVRLGLTILENRIVFATWESNGCPAAHKASNGLATFLRGRTLEQASKIDPDDLLVLIGGLPDGKGHYAAIAVEALRDALKSESGSGRPEIADTPDNYLI